MLTEDIIIQSEPEKQDKIRFWRKSFKTCKIVNYNFLTRQISKQNFHNASDFELKFLQRVRF